MSYGRAEAVRRRALRGAWAWLALGLLIPVTALYAAYIGWSHIAEAPRQGWALVVLGVAVFAVRLALYVM